MKSNEYETAMRKIEYIKSLPVEKLVEILNSMDEGDLSRAGFPDYIQPNNEEAHESIADFLRWDATELLRATEDGRFRYDDKWILFDSETDTIYTFSTSEELFGYFPASTLAEYIDTTMLDYIREKVVDFAEKEQNAMAIMEGRSCSFQYASPSFYDEVTEAIRAFCEDNGLDHGNYDTEDVFMDLR